MPVFTELNSRYLVSEFFRGIANGTYPIRLQGAFCLCFDFLLSHMLGIITYSIIGVDLNALVQEEVYVTYSNQTIKNISTNETCNAEPEPLPKGNIFNDQIEFFGILFCLLTKDIWFLILTGVALNPLWFFVNLVSLVMFFLVIAIALICNYFIDKRFQGQIHLGTFIFSLLLGFVFGLVLEFGFFPIFIC